MPVLFYSATTHFNNTAKKAIYNQHLKYFYIVICILNLSTFFTWQYNMQFDRFAEVCKNPKATTLLKQNLFWTENLILSWSYTISRFSSFWCTAYQVLGFLSKACREGVDMLCDEAQQQLMVKLYKNQLAFSIHKLKVKYWKTKWYK